MLDPVLDAIGGAPVVDHTTSSPADTAARRARLSERAAIHQHAPISMSPDAARAARGTILAWGPRTTFERMEPALAALTGQVVPGVDADRSRDDRRELDRTPDPGADRAVDRIDLALAVLVLIALGALARARMRSWRARARARRAIRGERRAELLLEARGYAIEARQHHGELVLEVDGAPHAATLRCDLVVTRAGRRFVAEVKTGALAPRLDHPPTRRQIVEYLLAFDADGVLLVDAERDDVREVRLRRDAPATSAWPWIAVAAVATAAWLATR